MPAVVVDSSVLITLAAGGQFHLLRELYTTLYVPPEVWHEVTATTKPYGTNETRHAREAGWLIIRAPISLATVQALPFNLQPGETEGLALAVELADALLLVDDAQGRRAARALAFTTPARSVSCCAPNPTANLPRSVRCSRSCNSAPRFG